MTRPLLDGPPEARVAAIEAFTRTDAAPGGADLDALRDCLGDASKRVQRRAAEAFALLASRGVEVGDRLRAALDAHDVHLRWGAAYALSLSGPLPLAALPTLLDVMALDDGDLRWAGADLVKQLAAADRIPVVRQLLAAALEPGAQRKMALYCLRDLAVVEAVDVALGALGDTAVGVRLAALAVLAEVHPNPAAAARRIAVLIGDRDPRMQRAAAGTLGRLGVCSAEIIGALRAAEASDDPSLRRAAARSLRALEAPSG
jgi:HEAT repeat protein